jgi:NAD(P)-dependent dehydrogenase (short-subunit alcohol dehydrogenase family)
VATSAARPVCSSSTACGDGAGTATTACRPWYFQMRWVTGRRGTINFDDHHFQSGYRYQYAYFQSKLANLLFTYELQRRLAAAGAATIAVAAHPGNARTEFGRELSPLIRVAMSPRLRMLTWWLLQSPQMGALAAVRAAVDPDARGGDYYGPPGRAQFTGYPTLVDSSARSHDADVQHRLWQVSEQLTGVTYETAVLPLQYAT